jgi:hypothetical protein
MNTHIGKLIRQRVDTLGMDVTVFAQRINCERSNAYHIFNRQSIDTELLKIIGQVLDYDFFQDLLLPETKEEIILKSRMSNKVFVEIELTEEEIEQFGLKEKVIKNLIDKK